MPQISGPDRLPAGPDVVKDGVVGNAYEFVRSDVVTEGLYESDASYQSMGASDWAGRMCMRLEERFDIHSERSIRLTTMVRLLRGAGAFGEHGSDRHEEHVHRLIDDLDKSLAAQPGETVEERWNSLMDDLGCQARTDEGVYLISWDDHDAEAWDELGRTTTPRNRYDNRRLPAGG